MSLEDHITDPPAPFMIIQDKKQLRSYDDPKLALILQILVKRPMTVSEVTIEFNKLEEKPKSEISIYNYLKKLQEVGLVIIAGRRITRGHTSALLLYGRAALLMLPKVLISKKYWDTHESTELIEVSRHLISLFTQTDVPTHKNLKNLLYKIYSCTSNELDSFLSTNQVAINRIIRDDTVDEIRLLVDVLSNIIIILNCSKFEKEFSAVFPSE